MNLICVRFQREGFHKWDNAPDNRAYLRETHRHVFHVEAQVEVHTDEREIEFHDLLCFCKQKFPQGHRGNLGGQSCETLARKLVEEIREAYPKRMVKVSVFEDGEVGAIVRIDVPVHRSQ